MKKILIAFVCSFYMIACNNEGENSRNKSDADSGKVKKTEEQVSVSVPEGGRYGIKSAKVVTVTTLPRNMGNTTITMYFDDYGKVSYSETVSNITMKNMPKISQAKQYTITQGEYLYSWKEGDKTGTKLKLALSGDLQNMNFEKMGKEMSEKMKIKNAGSETFLGKNCEVYELDNPQFGKGKILTWKNIPMLNDITSMGTNLKSEVTELEENPSLDPSKFKVPTDVEFKEIQIPVRN